MTQIRVWLDPDCWDEQFLFYNLYKVSIVSETSFKYFENFFLMISEERSCNFIYFLFINCLEIPSRSLVICTGRNALKIEHILLPIFNTYPQSNQNKRKTDVHNYVVSSIQIHLISFSSSSTFEAFVWKQKMMKNLSKGFNWSTEVDFLNCDVSSMTRWCLQNSKCPEQLSKYNAEIS